jgi:hypothetical protein
MKSFSKMTNKITAYQNHIQQLTYQLVDLLFDTSIDNFDQSINHALSLVGNFYEVDRILNFEFLFEFGKMTATHIYPNTDFEYIS